MTALHKCIYARLGFPQVLSRCEYYDVHWNVPRRYWWAEPPPFLDGIDILECAVYCLHIDTMDHACESTSTHDLGYYDNVPSAAVICGGLL